VAGVVFGANGLLVYGTTGYQFDPQGNAAHLMDDDGLVLAHLAYDAWGQPMSGNNPTPYGYKGQWGYYTDAETGLLLLTHRYFDPATGRFLTRDPIGVEGGINLYAYVGNGVVTKRDPCGLFDSTWCYAICAPLLFTPDYPLYHTCVATCVAVNDLCELNRLLGRVLKQSHSCHYPRSILDCYNCPGRGGVFQTRCYACCGALGVPDDRCQQACDAWRQQKERGKNGRRGHRTSAGAAVLFGDW